MCQSLRYPTSLFIGSDQIRSGAVVCGVVVLLFMVRIVLNQDFVDLAMMGTDTSRRGGGEG